MTAYFRFVLRHRVPVLLGVLLLTALAGLSMTRAEMATTLLELVMGDHPAYRAYTRGTGTFGSDEQLVVAFTEPRLGAPETVARIGRVAQRLKAMADVARVHTPLTAAWFAPRRAPAQGEALDVDWLLQNPLAEGLLVSSNGTSAAVLVELTPDFARPLERTPEIAGEIIDAFVESGFAREDLHVAGIPAVLAEVDTQTRRNLTMLLPAVAVLLLLATWVLFRRLWPVLVTLAVGAVAIVWTMGFAIALDPQVNVLLAIAPALILIIAFSDVVHLCSAYLLALAAGQPRDEAILVTASEVGKACLFTSLTTFAGFVGMTLLNVPGFRQLGLVLGFGVAVALLLAMTLVPILFSVMRAPKPLSRSPDSGRQHWLDAVLDAARRASTSRPWVVIAVFAAVAGGAALGSSRIRIESDITQRMSESNRLRRDTAWINERFAGTTILDLYVDVAFGPDVLERLDAYQRRLEAEADVGKVVSVITVLRAIAGSKPWLSADVLATYAAAARGPNADLFRQWVDSGSSRVRLVVFLRGTGMRATFRVAERAREIAAETLGPDVAVEPSGMMYLAGLWLEENVTSQLRAVLVTFGVITVMIMVLLRSVTAGLASMAPNMIPLLLLGGVIGLAWGSADSDVAVVAVIAIGIAVDDTIHFVTRYRTELGRGGTRGEAIGRTFSTAGRAIVMTSLIFAVGFAPFMLSDYLSIRMIGLLLPMVMVVALLADVLLLPALISVGAVGSARWSRSARSR